MESRYPEFRVPYVFINFSRISDRRCTENEFGFVPGEVGRDLGADAARGEGVRELDGVRHGPVGLLRQSDDVKFLSLPHRVRNVSLEF